MWTKLLKILRSKEVKAILIKILIRIGKRIFKKKKKTASKNLNTSHIKEVKVEDVCINEIKKSNKIEDIINVKLNKEAIIYWNESYDYLMNRGFNPLFVFIHIYHETGGFKRIIGKYNYWGIKETNPEKTNLQIKTHEYIDGKKITVYTYFKDWINLEEALKFYTGLIKRLYPVSYRNRKINHIEYFKNLTNGIYKYATDPKYSTKLINLFSSLIR